ncbi:MAG: right-handed parallel beta-helix repeat-containing protein [Bacteroidota bacterium]|nr:right-handed parallel beta-helix repeat-containing protein [Bacteroidota bacterium]
MMGILMTFLSIVAFCGTNIKVSSPVKTKMIEDFNRFSTKAGLNSTNVMEKWTVGAPVDIDLVDTPAPGIKKALKFTPETSNGSQPGFDFGIKLKDTDFTGADGIRFWVKNLSLSNREYLIKISFDEASGERWAGKESSIKYILIKNDGARKKNQNSKAEIRIPIGFEGYIEIAMNQFALASSGKVNGVLELNNISGFHIGGDSKKDKGESLLISNLMIYGDNVVKTKMIEDLSRFSTTAELDSSNVINNLAGGALVDIALESSRANGVVNAIRFTPETSNGIQADFDLGINLSNTDFTGADGIRFWTKNLCTNHNEFIIRICLNEGSDERWGGSDNVIKYTLVKPDGTRIGAMDVFGAIRIPKGFEGFVEIAKDQFKLASRSRVNGMLDLNDIASFHIRGNSNNERGESFLIGNLMIYGDHIIDTKVIEDFSRFANTTELNAPSSIKKWTDGAQVDITLENTPSPGIKKALKLTPKANNGTQSCFDFGINLTNTDLTGANGVRFWTKNLCTNHNEYIISVYFNESSGERWAGTEKGINYTLIKIDGSRINVQDSGAEIRIPKGFEGYVEIANDQFELVEKSKVNGKLDLNDIDSFHICGDSNNERNAPLLVSNLMTYGEDANMDFIVELPDLTGAVTVNAANFGISTTSSDNTMSLNRAIDYCKQFPSSILAIPSGIYRFNNTQTINVNNMNNFCIDGNNSEFIFSNLGQFRLNDCTHVLLKDVKVDWDWEKERLASLAEVIKIADESAFIEFEFPELEYVDTTLCFYTMNQFDKKTISPGTENGQEFWIDRLATKKVEMGNKPNQLRVYPKKGSFTNLSVGNLFLVRHTPRRGSAFIVNNCTHTTLKCITIYSAPGACFIISGETHHTRLDSCMVCLRPNSNRRMSSEADGFHIIQSKGYTIIENCDFSFMGDDDVNIHDCIGFVSSRVDDHTLSLENTYVGDQGDIFEIRNPDFSKSGDVLELLSKTGCRLTFKGVIPNYVTATYMILNKRYNSSNYIIRNNYFHHNRARGLLLQCSNGIVEDNTFDTTQGAAIYVMMETLSNHWYEGIGVNNLKICNNIFQNCNVNDWTSVIDIMAVIPNKNSNFPVFTNITIANNKFIEFPSGVIYINKAKGVTIKNNTFACYKRRANNKINRGYFYVNRSSDIRIKNNVWTPSPYITSPGYIDTNPDGDSKPNRVTYF